MYKRQSHYLGQRAEQDIAEMILMSLNMGILMELLIMVIQDSKALSISGSEVIRIIKQILLVGPLHLWNRFLFPPRRHWILLWKGFRQERIGLPSNLLCLQGD